MAKKKNILKIELEPKWMERLEEMARKKNTTPEELAKFYIKLQLVSFTISNVEKDPLLNFKPIDIEGVPRNFSELVDQYIYGDEK